MSTVAGIQDRPDRSTALTDQAHALAVAAAVANAEHERDVNAAEASARRARSAFERQGLVQSLGDSRVSPAQLLNLDEKNKNAYLDYLKADAQAAVDEAKEKADGAEAALAKAQLQLYVRAFLPLLPQLRIPLPLPRRVPLSFALPPGPRPRSRFAKARGPLKTPGPRLRAGMSRTMTATRS
jgi:hypothetical protein